MTPTTRTIMRLRYAVRLLIRAAALVCLVMTLIKTWFAVDQYIAWRASPRPSLPAGIAWSPEATLLRQLYEPGIFLGLTVALVLLESRLIAWLIPVPSRKCPGCGYSLEKLEGPTCPECGLEIPVAKDQPGP